MLLDWFPSASRLAHPALFGNQFSLVPEFPDAPQNGRLGKAAFLHHSLNATPPPPQCFAPHQPASLRFVSSPENLPEQGCVLLDVTAFMRSVSHKTYHLVNVILRQALRLFFLPWHSWIGTLSVMEQHIGLTGSEL